MISLWGYVVKKVIYPFVRKAGHCSIKVLEDSAFPIVNSFSHRSRCSPWKHTTSAPPPKKTFCTRSLKSRGVLLGLMLYLLNGFITTWVGFMLPLVAYNHFDFEVRQYGWLMVGVSGTATVASFTMAFLSKAQCMANNKHGDRTVLVLCYIFMIIAIVISYLGGPSVSAKCFNFLNLTSAYGYWKYLPFHLHSVKHLPISLVRRTKNIFHVAFVTDVLIIFFSYSYQT